MRRVFVEALPTGAEFALEGDAFHHLAHVLRVKIGEPITLLDGAGGAVLTTVQALEKRHLLLNIGTPVDAGPEPPLRICVGQAPGRGDRFDDALQHSVEVGACGLFPLMTERAVVKWPPGDVKRIERHRKIAVGAAEQCGRAKLPVVGDVQTLKQTLALAPGFRCTVLLHPLGEPLHCVVSPLMQQELSSHVGGYVLPPNSEQVWDLLLLIGPEGGFSAAELELSREAGVAVATMGPLVARNETAPVAAISRVLAQWDSAKPI